MWLHPSCCLRLSWAVLLLLLSSPASSQHEGLVTCCNLAYLETSSFCSAAAPSAKSDGARSMTGGSREKESSHAEPLKASLAVSTLPCVVVFCEIRVLLEGPQAQLPAQMLPILHSRSGFTSQTSERCRGTSTVHICEAEMLKYIESKLIFRQEFSFFSNNLELRR